MPALRSLFVILACALASPSGVAANEIPKPEVPGLAAVDALIEAGTYAEAESEGRALLARIEKENGPDSLAAAKVLDALVEALRGGGKSASPEARELAERAVSIRERVLGPDDPLVGVSLNMLGLILHEMGDLGGARVAYERSLSLLEAARGPDHQDVAFLLNNLAAVLRAQGDLAAARPLFERALAIREKRQGPDHLEVAASLNNLATLLADAGDQAAAGPLYERALAIWEKHLGPDHPNVASALNNLAEHRFDTGDLAGARPLYERALAIRERTLGPDHPRVAFSLTTLARLHIYSGEHALGRPLLERALSIYERTLGPDHPDVALSLNHLASLLRDAGDYAGALPHVERALAIREKSLGPGHERVAESLTTLASLVGAMGDAAAARRYQERAVEITEAALGPNHPEFPPRLRSLGRHLAALGDHAAALEVLERATALEEAARGPEHPKVASMLSDLAVAAAAAGDHARARALHERVLAVREKAAASDTADVAISLMGVAAARSDEDDAAGARALLERALAAFEAARGPDHPWVASCLSNLAVVTSEVGDHAEALRLYDRSLAIREGRLGPSHPDVARVLAYRAGTQARLGRIGEAFQDALRAETIGRDHALLTFRSLAERQALRVEATRPRGVDLLLSFSPALDVAARRRAWDALIRSRAVVLDELAARRREAAASAVPSPLEAELRRASQCLANLTVRGEGSSSPERYRKMLDEAARARERAERALAEHGPATRAGRGRDGIGFDDVARALPAGTALVAYALHVAHPMGTAGEPSRARTEPVYSALVLAPDAEDPVLLRLGARSVVDGTVERWMAAVRRGDTAGGSTPLQPGDDLRSLVWDPVVGACGAATRVLVVPDGALHLVSLAALPAPGGGYVVERGPTVHRLTTERDVVTSGGAASGPRALVAFGGPDFGDRLAARADGGGPGGGAPSSPAGSVRRSACGSFSTMVFEPLPGSAAECRDVARSWRRRRNGTPPSGVVEFSGAAADEAAFKREAPGRGVVHVATHGFFLGGACAADGPARARGLETTDAVDEEIPQAALESPLLRSGLALAGANRRADARADEEDGVLTADEVASLDLSACEWAVLSACGTGLGDVTVGEGVHGLQRAFRIAGARTVIMSLWPVDDAATRRFMRALYDARLSRRLDAADCVREAQLHVLRERRSRGLDDSPFWWGAFVSSGE